MLLVELVASSLFVVITAGLSTLLWKGKVVSSLTFRRVAPVAVFLCLYGCACWEEGGGEPL